MNGLLMGHSSNDFPTLFPDHAKAASAGVRCTLVIRSIT